LEQVTSSTVFEDDPQMISCLIPVVELENMTILQIMENSNLQNQVLGMSSRIAEFDDLTAYNQVLPHSALSSS